LCFYRVTCLSQLCMEGQLVRLAIKSK
jgi:hypothetical protein